MGTNTAVVQMCDYNDYIKSNLSDAGSFIHILQYAQFIYTTCNIYFKCAK